MPPRYLPKENIYEKNNTFSVVRNPYHRIVSEYQYINSGPNRIHTISKDGLNKFVHENLTKLIYDSKNANPYIHDCHLIPQVDFIYNDNRYNESYINDILKQENLNKDFSKLSKKYALGFDIDSRHMSTQHFKNKVTINDLDEKSKELIRIYYKKDFEKFKYNPYPRIRDMHSRRRRARLLTPRRPGRRRAPGKKKNII